MEGSGQHHRNPASPRSNAKNEPRRRLVDDDHIYNNNLPENPYSIGTLESSFGGLSLNGRDYGHDRYQQSPSQLGIGWDVGYHGSAFSDPLRNQGSFNADLGEFLGNSGGDYGQMSYSDNTSDHLRSLLCSRNPTLIDQNMGYCRGGLRNGNANGIDNIYWKHNCSCVNEHDAQHILLRYWQLLQQQEQRYGRLLNSVPCSNGNGYPSVGVPDGIVASSVSKISRASGNNRRNLLDNSNNDNKLQPNLSSLNLMDLQGKLVSWAKDQNGCRLLQVKFDKINKEEIEMVFTEVIGDLAHLMTHPFANYLIQKLVEVCSEEQRTKIVLSLCETEFQLVRICIDTHGTRAVQKLLEHLTTRQQISMVMSALRPGVVALTKDMNGYHVIQHCLKRFSAEENEHLLNEVADNCFGIARDKCGCCVLQSCVDNSEGVAKERLIAEIVANAFHLAEDRYGNYVVQMVVGLRISHVTAKILKQLEGRFVCLSCSKYGSNVVEKCLLESMEEHAAWIVCEMLGSPNISLLLSDPFGNYVIQRALQVSRGAVFEALIRLVQSNLNSMRSNLYGKKVLAWLEKRHIKFQQSREDMRRSRIN